MPAIDVYSNNIENGPDLTELNHLLINQPSNASSRE